MGRPTQSAQRTPNSVGSSFPDELAGYRVAEVACNVVTSVDAAGRPYELAIDPIRLVALSDGRMLVVPSADSAESAGALVLVDQGVPMLPDRLDRPGRILDAAPLSEGAAAVLHEVLLSAAERFPTTFESVDLPRELAAWDDYALG